MKDFHEMTDEELANQVELIGFADDFLRSPAGKLIKEVADRIVERAVREFALSADVSKDVEKLIELKVIIKKYKFELFSEIERISRDGYLVYEVIKNRHLESLSQESLNTTEKGDVNG